MFCARPHSFHHEGGLIRTVSEEDELMGTGPVVKEQGDKIQEDPWKGREGSSCPETLIRQETGSWLPLLEVDFRKAAAPWAWELFFFFF